MADLESPDPGQRRRAAETRLALRLTRLHRIDDSREIDLDFLTCAEYQPFLDDLRARGVYRQPEHWPAYTFAAGHGPLPVGGVRREDARAFCAWLTERLGGMAHFRLPTRAEAREHPANLDRLATWCVDPDETRDDPVLIDVPSSLGQEIRRQIEALSGPPVPWNLNLGLDLSIALMFARPRTRRRDDDPRQVVGLVVTCALDRSLNPGLALGIDRAIARDLVGELAELSGLHYIILRALKRDLDEARGLANGLVGGGAADVRLTHLGRLTVALIDAASAQSVQNARHAWRRAALAIFESGSVAVVGRSRSGGDVPTRDFYVAPETLLHAYWPVRILVEREDGTLPAWDAIRIVREHPGSADRSAS